MENDINNDYFVCEQVESGCRAIGCHWDVYSNSCGYFQIKQGYWTDCGSPGHSNLFNINSYGKLYLQTDFQDETILYHYDNRIVSGRNSQITYQAQKYSGLTSSFTVCTVK